MENNINELKSLFHQSFGEEALIIEAPGRINLIGEHTDYNDGFVLPGAIDKSAIFFIQLSGSNQCKIVANDLKEEYSFSINEKLRPVEQHWVNYFLGVIDELKNKNCTLNGFNLMFSSDIPIGSGLSSSAAIECGFGYALDQLFDLGIPRMELALIGQKSEHKFAGVKCGIMDQFASIMGKEGHVMQLDCRSLDYEYIPADFTDYQLVLFDTQVKHNLADSEYNIRRKQCEKGLNIIKKVNSRAIALRDVSISELIQAQSLMDQKIFDRCKYVIEENERVQKVCDALKTKNIEKVGQLMFDTHYGLSNLYEVSCYELDLLVDLVKKQSDVIGARMMGGGFGGCTINLIKLSGVEEVVEKVKSNYLTHTGIELKVYKVSISDGVKIKN